MTEITPPKESTTSPIEPEKTHEKVESKSEVTPVQPEGEVTAESKPEEKKKEEEKKEVEKKEAEKKEEEKKEEETAKEPIPETINEGNLNKRGPGLLKFWRKTYFAFGTEPTPLQDLQVYYKKNAKKFTPTKKSAAVTSTTTPVETEDTTAEPPKAEESTSSDVVEVKESKEVEDKKPETKEPEIKEAEDKKPETKESEIKEAEDKKPETKEPEIKEVEDKKPETKEPEIKEAEDKKSDTKEEEPANVNHIFYSNIAHATQTGEGLLFYYRSKNEKSHPIGIINLKDVTDVKELNEHHIGRSFAFRIETSYRGFELAADTKLERERWIKTIKEKADQYKEANETVKNSEGYKNTYDRLIQGTAFHPAKPGEAAVMSDELFSGDEVDDKPRSTEPNKRKSIFPNFFSGRKPSTSETAAVSSETPEDGKATTATDLTKIATATPEETEEIKSGEVSPKSPQRASKFLAFFKKSDKDETTPPADDVKEKDEKAKATEETTNAETSTAAVTSTAESTQNKDHKDHKESTSFLKIFKSKPKDETIKEDDNTETKVEPTEPSAEATTPEVKSEEKPETKSEDKTAEIAEKQDRSFFRILKDLSKGSGEDKVVETPEEKVESKSEEKKPEKEENKESDKKEEKKKESDKKEEKKKDKKKKDEKEKKGEDSLSESQSDSSSEEDKAEPSLVRRVTTKIFRRAKSPKAEEKSREATDKAEVAEEKKDAAETTDPTEKDDASAPTAEQTVPESSTEPTDDKKKKEKSSKLLSFGRRISGGVGSKRQNSLPSHESTQEKGETGETGETAEPAETAAVATATEATDIENADKTTKSEKEKEPEHAVQKHVIPEGIKKGTLRKQTQIFKTFDPRYFVLTEDKKLRYYRSSNDANTEKAIDLSSDCKVKIGEGTKFDLETKTRTYKLIADSEEERDSWIKELKELGVASEEHGKKTEEAAKLEVPKSENVENGDIQQSVDIAADKAADAAEASVSEGQETTTKSTKVETTEGTEETTVTTTTTTTIVET